MSIRSYNSLLKAVFIFFVGISPSTSTRSVETMLAPSAEARPLCQFFPPNKLHFPITNSGHMSEMQFRKILQVVSQVYTPIFRQNGKGRFAIVPRWQDETVNAFAFICNDPSQIGTPNYPAECAASQTAPGIYTPTSIIVMFGGLARHPLITQEGFVLVACHEIGHHLGGFPRYANNTSWAAAEGQSDYFSTSKCARKVLTAIGGNAIWAQRAAIPLDVRVNCNNSFPGVPEQAAICMRSALGGLALARVLGSFTGDPKAINFKFPDPTKVPQTFEGHPQAQCRLDTYYAGAVCRESEYSDFSPMDPRPGACHPLKVNRKGSRPACWYKDPYTN